MKEHKHKHKAPLVSYSIVLIGSGNVAGHLGYALKKAGHKIVQVYSPTLANAEVLANEFECGFTNKLNNISTDAQLYIVCIKDDAIPSVTKKLKLKQGIIVHTAGSVDSEVLKSVSKNYGVLYPLQTFSKTKKVKFKHIPLFIEANNSATLNLLRNVAQSISRNVIPLNSEQRKSVHVAAVFACNFTNHLLKISQDILAKNKIPFNVLKPLITETIEKAFEMGPSRAQTGPAIRSDRQVIVEHEALLEKDTEALFLYKALTKSIIKSRKK